MAMVAGVTIGITGAWWSDDATSVNASFNSGTIDLQFQGKKVDGTGSSTVWRNDVGQTWDTTNMSPGGAGLSATLPMKNVGSTDSNHMDFAIANTPSETGMDKYMRITKLTYDGKSLLEGGAGAVIPEYVAPISCNLNVNMPGVADSIPTITAAMVLAASGNTICVGPGDYSTAWETSLIDVDESVTIVSTDGPGSTTISAGIKISADGATIKGFTISKTGISSTVYSDITIKDNIITDISSSNSTVYGITIVPGAASISGITIENNQINDLHYTGALDPGHSVAGIAFGWSTGTGVISNVQIQNNIISNITSNTSAWKVGHGAYGMLINHGVSSTGYVTGLSIAHNTITNLEGLWVHAIGLETNTQNTSVTLNDISNLVDHKFPSDAIAVFLEDNPNGGTVVVNNNNFASDVSWGVAMLNSNGAVDATNNWWGDFDPSDQVFVDGNGSIDTSNHANGPFVGLINGVDTYVNGFADLKDFQAQGIKDVEPGLGAGEEKDLTMDVQLDALTPNLYQGQNVAMTMTVTMQQGPIQ